MISERNNSMSAIKKQLTSFIFIITALLSCGTDSENGTKQQQEPLYQFWLSNPDQSAKFQKQNTTQTFSVTNPQIIEINEAQTFQTMDGFGCTLTGGSAQLINQMSADAKSALLKELFAFDGDNIGISYLRISVGASDLDDHVFSYNDLPAGQTDTAMAHFTLDPDRAHLIPVLKTNSCDLSGH
jgi:glucosylceramidase